MTFKIHWDKVKNAHFELMKSYNFTDNNELIFIAILRDGTAQKSIVKFKDFYKFFWKISENTNINVATLVIQDSNDNVIFRHSQENKSHEEIPVGGNTNVVLNWKMLRPEERDTYIKLLISQIQSYE